MALTDKENELLSFGYVREQFIHTVPVTLIKLCTLYCGTCLIFDSLIEISTLKDIDHKNEQLCDEWYKMSHIMIRPIIYIDKTSISTNKIAKIIQYALEIKITNNSIKYIDLCYGINCQQKQISCKGTSRFTKTQNVTTDWQTKYQIQLSECLSYEYLNFECFIDVLSAQNNNYNIINIFGLKHKKVFVNVKESVADHDEHHKPKTFTKMYSIQKTINEIMEDSYNYFNYPFPLNQLEFDYMNFVQGIGKNSSWTLMDHMLQYDDTSSKMDCVGALTLFNFCWRYTNRIKCPLCKQLNVLGYVRTKWYLINSVYDDCKNHLNDYGGSVIYYINNEWKCGNCWKLDAQFEEKLNMSQ